MKNQRGSLTLIALFTILVFSLYGIILYGKSASAYITQTSSIETIQKAYSKDLNNAVQIAKQLSGETI